MGFVNSGIVSYHFYGLLIAPSFAASLSINRKYGNTTNPVFFGKRQCILNCFAFPAIFSLGDLASQKDLDQEMVRLLPAFPSRRKPVSHAYSIYNWDFQRKPVVTAIAAVWPLSLLNPIWFDAIMVARSPQIKAPRNSRYRKGRSSRRYSRFMRRCLETRVTLFKAPG